LTSLSILSVNYTSQEELLTSIEIIDQDAVGLGFSQRVGVKRVELTFAWAAGWHILKAPIAEDVESATKITRN
jgi:hypothetical protein